MLQKLLFPLFLVLVGILSSVYFSYRLSEALLFYCSLTRQAEVHISRWEVKEAQGKFIVKAAYSFEFGNSSWTGSSIVDQGWYLNEAAAIEDLREKANKQWLVWFDPSSPWNSSIEKSFPKGLLFRTATCYAVFIWFVIFLKKIPRDSPLMSST